MDNNVCVYYHVNKITMEVFYVGIGNIQRPYVNNKSNRSKEWIEYVRFNKYDIVILHTDLSWGEAIKIEKQLIKQIGRQDKGAGTLINKSDGGEGQQSKTVWLEKELFAEALKYKTRSEFYNKSRGAYKAATRRGILRKICSHMIVIYMRYKFKLTEKNCLKMALKFKNKSEFMSIHKSIYNKIISKGWQKTCFAHMRQKVNKDYCKEVALTFNRRIDLMKDNKYIYNFIIKNHWGEELFSHMALK